MLPLHREATSGSPVSTEGYVICTIAVVKPSGGPVVRLQGNGVDQRCDLVREDILVEGRDSFL
jgi:hypothetical protein